MSSVNFDVARRNMVEYQIRCCKVLDPVVLDTLQSMPRENFLPENVRNLAYMEGHVPLPCGQEMLSPLQEASIMQALDLQGTESVLEIGTGTGYLTALLAMHAANVLSCEIHQPVAELAVNNLRAHGADNAKVVNINAMQENEIKKAVGKQKFDVIVVGAALSEIPAHISNLLADSGQMIAFVGCNPLVVLTHFSKIGDVWQRTEIFETLLSDMEGLPERRELVF